MLYCFMLVKLDCDLPMPYNVQIVFLKWAIEALKDQIKAHIVFDSLLFQINKI